MATIMCGTRGSQARVPTAVSSVTTPTLSTWKFVSGSRCANRLKVSMNDEVAGAVTPKKFFS